jgi:hypothetical protein
MRSKIWEALVNAESLNNSTLAQFYSGGIGTFRWSLISRFVTLHGTKADDRDREGEHQFRNESNDDYDSGPRPNSVSFDWLVECLSRCSRLSVLDFNGCTFLQDEHLISILAPRLGTDKQRRKIRNSSTSKADRHVATTHPADRRLRVLGLHDCALLTNRSLRLIQRFEELEQLDLGGVASVDDNLLMQILHGRKSSAATISSLSLRGCHAVGQTPGAIRMLVAGMPRLRSLDLSQVSKLTGLLPARSGMLIY